MTREDQIALMENAEQRISAYLAAWIAKNPKVRAALRRGLHAIHAVDDGPLVHASDCALHNAPALPVGPCDCGLNR